MNCKKVENKLPFFIEKNLSETTLIQIQEHINDCSDCTQLYDDFLRHWKVIQEHKQIEPSPYYRIKLQQKLDAYEEKENSRFGLFPNLLRAVRPALITALLLIGILLGNYLGDFSKVYQSNANKYMIKNPMFVFFDSMKSVPYNSVESVSLKIKFEE